MDKIEIRGGKHQILPTEIRESFSEEVAMKLSLNKWEIHQADKQAEVIHVQKR